MQGQEEREGPEIVEVPEPDITSPETLKPWVERYVNTISNGMRDKSTPEKPLTEEQLLALEQEQFYMMLQLKGRRSDDIIRTSLRQTAQDIYDPKKDPLNLPKSPKPLQIPPKTIPRKP